MELPTPKKRNSKKKIIITIIIIILVIILISINIYVFMMKINKNGGDYWNQRNQIMAAEQHLRIGGNLKLTSPEEILNRYLLAAKFKEYDLGVKNESLFLATQNFLTVQTLIKKSPIFKLIQKMPKGGVLHVHDSAMVSDEFIYNLTFTENLYLCYDFKQIKFKFLKRVNINNNTNCDWKLLSEIRNPEINELIRSKLTLKGDRYPENNQAIWNKFSGIFDTIGPIIRYKPNLEKYWYQAFLEFYQDNVMYLEIRGSLSPIYDLNGNTSDPVEVLGIYNSILIKFKKANPDFQGAKFIYAPHRARNNQLINENLIIYRKLIKAYPDFVAGLDLVGPEDNGRPLIDFVDQLSLLKTKFFFHAGETNWNGLTDLNLIDAVLLGASRIGHGYALTKHPVVLEKVRELGIGIEVCPISNQVLGLVEDLRNHPVSVLFANNYPVVIAPDDPSFWGAKGLSYDFYVAFMAFTERKGGISVLKQLGINSILFSAMSIAERDKNLVKFYQQWEQFVNKTIIDFNLEILN